MEIVGGFMVMLSILTFFLAVIWLIMPFVVFTIKGKLDRTLDVLAGLDQRLATIEARLAALQTPRPPCNSSPASPPDAPLPPPSLPLA